nr:MAG TPA: hypothetical protein [Caudoviricetes sp.]
MKTIKEINILSTKKNNGHYSLVKFSNGKGITVAATKMTIFNYLKEIYKSNDLVEKK